MPKAASSVHDSVTSSIRFDLPDGASEDDRKLVAKIIARCVETPPPVDPLARHVEGMCWTWTGAKSGGYGRTSVSGATHSTHRIIGRVVHSVPPQNDVDHLCRNKLCCNPKHLESVTKRENTRRGLSAPNINVGVCRACGSSEGRVKTTRGGVTWRCTPCQRRWNRESSRKLRGKKRMNEKATIETIERLANELAGARAERDAAIRERDARPEISRSIAERIATWMDAERMEAIDAPTVTPAWVTEAIDALRAHAARATNGDANG